MKKNLISRFLLLSLFFSVMLLGNCHVSGGQETLPDFSGLQILIDDFAVDDVALIIGDEEGVLYSYEKGDVTVNTRMLIASANKWLTGAAVWSLIEKGVLSRNVHPGDYIEFWTEDESDLRSTITLDHLLGQTSGFNNPPPIHEYIGNPTYSLAEAVEHAYSGELDSDPGEKFSYGPEHFQIAAMIASRAQAEKDFRLILREEIFNPAGMSSDTGFPLGAGDNARYSGGILSTAADYGLFLRAMLAGELFDDMDGFLEDRTAGVEFGYRPIDYNDMDWHYAFGFWKECDQESWDDSCNINPVVSSPGAFGFTPWIDFQNRYWGVIAFYQLSSLEFLTSMESVLLEQKIQEYIEAELD